MLYLNIEYFETTTQNRLTVRLPAGSVNTMKRKDDDAGGRLISSAIVLLILTSLAPLISSGGPAQQAVLSDANIFSSSSSNESYDLFIDSSTSQSGGDGSISTAEPDFIGSSEELWRPSTACCFVRCKHILIYYQMVEFSQSGGTNEMISDIMI